MANSFNSNEKMSLDELVLAPFNQILGTVSSNVPAYSNTSDEVSSIERHYMHGIFMGIKWQCVEFARRWLLLRKTCVFKGVRHAADIWKDITHVERVTDGQHFPLKAHPNGSTAPPKVDTFLIYSRSEEQPVGHIAVICEVGPNYIRIAEQNNKFHYWTGGYAREIPLVEKDGHYFIEDEDPLYGWMEIEDHQQLKPLDQLDLDNIHSQYRETPPPGKISRCLITKPSDLVKASWLNKDDPAENFFLEHSGENFSSDSLPYYKINIDFLMNTAAISNDLHRMFVEATDRVIHDDSLLTHFQIPTQFWRRIRQSWKDEQNLALVGRFDLAFDGQIVKALRYQADTTSTLFQCALILKKWAEAIRLPSTFTSGRRLHELLVNIWKNMKIPTKIHLFIKHSEENMLTALYMQRVLKEAGIDSKLCLDPNQFSWKDQTIVDNDGEQVKMIWKLWTWEEILADSQSTAHLNETHPTLADIFLHEGIRIIEPFWKIITSHPALFSVLRTIYPNHPNLIEQSTDGEASFPLTKYDDRYAMLNSWIVRGHFAGFSVRESGDRPIENDSPVIPCCVVWEEEK